MNTFPGYTQNDILSHAGSTIFARGREYHEGGSVEELVQRGNTLHAEVEGSAAEAYHVTIHFTATGIGNVACTCPYGGWCKHVVATLLTALENPQAIENHPPLEELLKGLTLDQLYALVVHLAAENLNLDADIEAWVARQQLTAIVQTTPATTALAISQPIVATAPLDAKATRQQVRKALKGVSKVDAAEQLLNQILTMIEQGDAANAYVMLDNLTDEFVAALPDSNDFHDHYYDDDEDDGDDGSFDLLPQFDDCWTDLLLSGNFSKSERTAIGEKLTDWDETIEERSGDTALDAAQLALNYGWDYPPLQRVLAGEITEKGAWDEEEVPFAADQLAIVRLRILARQGRTQEYLNLAQAEGQFTPYLLMLVQLGRIEAATNEAIEFLNNVDELFQVVQALHQRGAIEEAIRVARHGLAQKEGIKYPLAKWLHDLYLARGDHKSAVPLLVSMVSEQPSLIEYQRLQSLAGSEWSQVQSEMLNALRKNTSFYHGLRAKAEIFLSEQLWDDAIALVNDNYDSATLAFVMERVVQQRPNWVIQTAKQRAEAIMSAGKANHYQDAVDWLKHAKKTYQAVNRGAEWSSYVQSIRSEHQRKYKLMGLLGQL